MIMNTTGLWDGYSVQKYIGNPVYKSSITGLALMSFAFGGKSRLTASSATDSVLKLLEYYSCECPSPKNTHPYRLAIRHKSKECLPAYQNISTQDSQCDYCPGVQHNKSRSKCKTLFNWTQYSNLLTEITAWGVLLLQHKTLHGKHKRLCACTGTWVSTVDISLSHNSNSLLRHTYLSACKSDILSLQIHILTSPYGHNIIYTCNNATTIY